MNNYEYIIAGLPLLQSGSPKGWHIDCAALIGDIRSNLSARDNALLDFFLSGYDQDSLGAAFYETALSHRNRFIREFFTYDLMVRNTKVDWINSTVGRPEGTDVIKIDSGLEDEELMRQEVRAVLDCGDIIRRERGLDDLMWRKADELTLWSLFDMSVILTFTAKLKVVERWEKLDPETGQEYFRKLVQEIRATYDNKKNTDIQ